MAGNGKSVAVITGGSSGMGLACAHRLGAQHDLIIADINQATLDAAAAALHAAGHKVTPMLVDVTQRESVARLAEAARGAGRLAALVNSAGIVAPTANAEWGARGGRIMTISPGMITSPMGEYVLADRPNLHQMQDKQPVARWGSAAEIGLIVEFLLSPGAGFITGTDLRIDGGMIPFLRQQNPA